MYWNLPNLYKMSGTELEFLRFPGALIYRDPRSNRCNHSMGTMLYSILRMTRNFLKFFRRLASHYLPLRIWFPHQNLPSFVIGIKLILKWGVLKSNNPQIKSRSRKDNIYSKGKNHPSDKLFLLKVLTTNDIHPSNSPRKIAIEIKFWLMTKVPLNQ